MKSKFNSLERFNGSVLLKKQIIVILCVGKAIKKKNINRIPQSLLHKYLLLTTYWVNVENFILKKTQAGLTTQT